MPSTIERPWDDTSVNAPQQSRYFDTSGTGDGYLTTYTQTHPSVSNDNPTFGATPEWNNGVGCVGNLSPSNWGHEAMNEVLEMDGESHKSEPEEEPFAIRERKTSLRARLIRGQYEPQVLGMRAFKMRKAATQAPTNPVNIPKPCREFLVQKKSRSNAIAVQPLEILETIDSGAEIQPNLRIAYKSTPIHQLRFPEALVLSIQKNALNWRLKKHSPNSVFVVLRIIGDDVPDTHVFESLSDATADALHLIAYKHPELFILTRDEKYDGREIKVENTERVSTAIKRIIAPPVSRIIHPVRRKTRRFAPNTSSRSETEGVKQGHPISLIKEEDPESPPRPRIPEPAPDLNNRGQLLLKDTPEPTYVFLGKHKITQFGLKMEATRPDRVVVKVHVRLNTLRKPTRK